MIPRDRLLVFVDANVRIRGKPQKTQPPVCIAVPRVARGSTRENRTCFVADVREQSVPLERITRRGNCHTEPRRARPLTARAVQAVFEIVHSDGVDDFGLSDPNSD